MLNKSFGVIYFHFNIFSTKTAKKTGVKICIFGFLRMCPRLAHFTLLMLASLRFKVHQKLLDGSTGLVEFCSRVMLRMIA